MTAGELAALPTDHIRRELVRGQLGSMPLHEIEHGAIEGGVAYSLGCWLDDNPIGEVAIGGAGFRLQHDPDTVRAADVAFIRAERLPSGELPKAFFPGAPDLAVEIVSPGATAAEVEEKVRDWLDGGARAVWVVYPAGPRLMAHLADGSARHHGPQDEVDGGDVLPGFRMRVVDLVRRPGQPRS